MCVPEPTTLAGSKAITIPSTLQHVKNICKDWFNIGILKCLENSTIKDLIKDELFEKLWDELSK